ncbi:MAG TPA: hypothetical protein VGC08_15530 [Pedobacter sp.]
MVLIPFIDDAYIDDIIKAADPYDPALNKTQGVKMRELRDYIKDSNSQFTAEYTALLARVETLENTSPKYTPEPPTNGSVLESTNISLFIFSPSNMALNKTDYEYTLDNGITISPAVSSNSIDVGNINIPAGYVKVRVKESEYRYASAWLSSDQPFTQQ